ncbi:RNA methyltransferase [Gordonia sp. TBRC 11910]|uniref:RNA methyltransferase n=1 Tax=Gordonia asplenii TaxID=2725283 RepID=A0A848L1X9_9ACTN|nr:RNA methyltransferase [Gordonia asplenii]NMO04874.1 RNA methyltransferase [Gordonia asplenii]
MSSDSRPAGEFPTAQPLSERSSRVVSYAKLARASVRRERREFLAEGANAVTAALDTGRARQLLVRDSDAERFAEVISRAASDGVPVSTLTARAADKLTETSTAPGIFAICSLLDADLGTVLRARPALLAIAVEMREPGNAGTLIRCADAMGADAVVLLGDSVDPHNGKCVRASAGSVFHVPVIRERDITVGLDAVRAAGLTVLATAVDGELSLDAASGILTAPTAWLFGNEAHGLPDDVASSADYRVSIPIRGRAESLNLAAASAICLYASSAAHAH